MRDKNNTASACLDNWLEEPGNIITGSLVLFLTYSTLDSKFSPHPYRNYQKKEGKGWKNGEPDSDHIELMTKKFLEDGGRITVLPTTESKRIMKEVDFKENDKVKNWSEESNMKFFWNRKHQLCPYNIYRTEVDKDWNESNHLCENREFWTEKMIPLMKEESSDFESSCELEDRLDDVNEFASRYSTSYQMNQ